VTCVSPETGAEVVVRACQEKVYPGMKVKAVSEEIQIDFE